MENAIDLSQEQEIARFIQSNFTLEYQVDLTLAIEMLLQFEYEGICDALCELLYSPTAEDTDATSVTFSRIAEDALSDLIKQHGVTTDNATLSTDLEVIRGIYHVQHIEDPVPYLRIIEGNTQSPEEKLATILSQFSVKDETFFLTALAEVEESFLNRLYLKLTEQEEKTNENSSKEIDVELLSNFKLFIQRYGKTNLGYSIVNTGTPIGLPISDYVGYFAGQIDVSHPDVAAMDLLSLFFLASDTWQSPVIAYRDNSEQLLNNTKDLQVIESKMQQIFESYAQYKKANDDHASLSSI